MTILTFEDKHRGNRIQIWLDELPSVAFLPDDVEAQTFMFEDALATACRSRVCIEALRPHGAAFSYGLLGVDFQPATTAKTSLSIPVDSAQRQRRHQTSMTAGLDEVTVGSPSDYTAGICAAFEHVEADARPSGNISVRCMAHGTVGSSRNMFTSLARGVVRLLTDQRKPASLDEAMQLLA